jgi:hypothetical protein
MEIDLVKIVQRYIILGWIYEDVEIERTDFCPHIVGSL